MEKQIINLKLFDGRVVQFFDMYIKLYDTLDDYKYDRNFRYATEEDYNKAIDTEFKLYSLLGQANIQNPEILTENEKNIIKKFFEAFEAVDDQYESFDSTVADINDLLEMVFCRKVSIW